MLDRHTHNIPTISTPFPPHPRLAKPGARQQHLGATRGFHRLSIHRSRPKSSLKSHCQGRPVGSIKAMAAEAEAAGEPWPLPEDVSRFIDEQPIERVLEALAELVRTGREGFRAALAAAQESPARAAELEARIEGADSVHGLVFMALFCEAVEPVRARLARLTRAAADPPAEAARLIQAEGLPLGEVEVGDGPRGITAVAAATVFGNAPVLRFFLAQPGVDPRGWAVHGQTLVSFAAMFGHVACIQALLAAGADPNAGEPAPVFRAMRTKQPGALKALLADPRTAVGGADGDRTLLGWAVAAGDLPCLEALLADGRVDVAGPILLGQAGLTCLHIAAAHGRLPVLRRLLRATRGKVPVDAVHDRGSTPLASAISVDWAEGARVLIEEGGADPMRRMAEAENMTNLMFAAAAGKVESVKFLVEATPLGRQGAEGLDAAMEDGTTALFHACWRGHTDCVRALLRQGKGADPNRIIYSRPILQHAVRRPDNHAMLDAFLQDPRLDLDAPCHVGSYTALHYALQFLTWAGNPPAPAPADIPAILGRLLAAGADPRVEDGHGRTPMAWAGSVWDEAMARGDMVVVDAAMASMELLQAGLVEPERLALLHKARRLVDTGYALPAVAAGARTRHGGRSRSVAAAPECLRGRVAAGAALPEVEVAVVKPPAQAPEKPPPQKTKTQTRKRRGRKRKRQQRGAVDEEEEEEEKAETGEGRGAVAAPAAAAAPAEVRNEVLARVLGIPPPPSLEGDGKSPVAAAAIAQAQAGEEKSGPVVFPRELFVELEALMGVRWADAWRG